MLKMRLAEIINSNSISFDRIENIAHFNFSTTKISVDEFKDAEEAIFNEMDQRKFYSVIEVGDYTKLSVDLKEYLISEDRSWKIHAEAILTKNFAKKFLMDLYFQLNLPLVPTKTFTQTEDAKRWLNSVRNDTLSRA